MRLSRTAVFWIIAAAFVAFLAYSSLRVQRVTCEVCIEFGGGNRCAKASGPDEAAASETAQTAACGPLARGMDETIACGRLRPTSVSCKG
ncbi:MAG: hypothetical protein ACKVZ0_15795 [Gemmatimonadales bacterium]